MEARRFDKNGGKDYGGGSDNNDGNSEVYRWQLRRFGFDLFLVWIDFELSLGWVFQWVWVDFKLGLGWVFC